MSSASSSTDARERSVREEGRDRVRDAQPAQGAQRPQQGRPWQELRTVFEDARDDAAVRGVILTGAGDKAFIAGADIGEMANDTRGRGRGQTSRHGQDVLNLIENLGKPVIAAVNGFALGGGCETGDGLHDPAGRRERAKFGQPEVTIGIIPGGGGTQRLPRLVGKGRALQLILTGEMIERPGGLSDRPGQRNRSGRQPHPARRSDPEQDHCQRPDRGEVWRSRP